MPVLNAAEAMRIVHMLNLTRVVALVPYGVIAVAVVFSTFPVLQSGTHINHNVDFFQYAARHEAVRRSLTTHHVLSLWSPWFGGGVPVIGDPEDPSLNPLIVFPLLVGTVQGLKVLGIAAVLIGALATYALARHALGYTVWGAMYSALVWGLCPFVPMRLLDGNTNEIYAAFLPVCLGLLAWAARYKGALILLPVVFYTMLSDGKATALMIVLYAGLLSLVALIPSITLFPEASPANRHMPARWLKYLAASMGVAALIGMVRFLPAAELLRDRGGLQAILRFHPSTYQPKDISAYSAAQLWKETVALHGTVGPITVGWSAVLLAGMAAVAAWRRMLPWLVCLAIFAWLTLAHHAPIDLLRALWHFPVFDTITKPSKYFAFQIPFTLAILAGAGLSLLRHLTSRRLEVVCALALTGASVGLLFPSVRAIHRRTYTTPAATVQPRPGEGFFQVQAAGLPRSRRDPADSLPYYNVRRNVGTTDWYTGIPAGSAVEPKYFIHRSGMYVPNEQYRGEAYFTEPSSANELVGISRFEPNRIAVPVRVERPGVLVINQNFNRDWHTDRGILFERDGLIAVRLYDAGTYTVRLHYVPRGFYAGLLVTMLAVAALTAICVTYRRGLVRQWAGRETGLRRAYSRAVLWTIE